MDKVRVMPLKKSSIISKLFAGLIFALIALGIYFSAMYVMNGDIIFHTDIARDFMLMEDMVASRKPTLIGPKIGPVPGLFHGPLWLYVNLPLFILGQGDPVVVGWGWVVMGILFVGSVYWAVQKMFNRNAALLAALFLSSQLAFYSHQLFNPSGAVMVTPLFFYLYWKYFESRERKYLFFLSLALGCLIQFEVAFGLPMAMLVTLSVIYSAIKSKKLSHPLYLLGILIPLSTYLLFDLRHDFFQLRSALSYVQSTTHSGNALLEIARSRIGYIISTSYGYFAPANLSWAKFLYLAVLLVSLMKGLLADKKTSLPYRQYLYLFGGYWLLTLFYQGRFEGYYSQSLQILTLMIFSSAVLRIGSLIPWALLLPTIYLNLQHAKVAAFSTYDYSGNQASSWLYNLNLAKKLYEDTGEQEFGYFALSEDLLAYSPKYAIIYAQRFYTDTTSHLFTKKPTTYVLISKDAYKQGTIDVRWWEEGQVKISKEPLSVYDSGYYLVKKYSLTETEVQIDEDPNLMQGIQFR